MKEILLNNYSKLVRKINNNNKWDIFLNIRLLNAVKLISYEFNIILKYKFNNIWKININTLYLYITFKYEAYIKYFVYAQKNVHFIS